MSNKKTSIQEKILRLLHGKNAVNKDYVHKEIEGDFEAYFEASAKPKYAINRSLRNLSESGFIEELESDNSSYVRITPEGRQKLHSIKLSSPTSLVPTSWDGYWRIVMLDLPEARKSERNSLRYILKKAGFIMLKNSVWVSPYPLEHLFMNLKKDMGLSNEITILVTQLLDPETEMELMETFGLK